MARDYSGLACLGRATRLRSISLGGENDEFFKAIEAFN